MYSETTWFRVSGWIHVGGPLLLKFGDSELMKNHLIRTQFTTKNKGVPVCFMVTLETTYVYDLVKWIPKNLIPCPKTKQLNQFVFVIIHVL